MQEYIHKHHHFLELEILRVKKSKKLSGKSKKLILDYYKHDFPNGLSLPRLYRMMGILRVVGERYGIEYSNVTARDYECVIGEIKECGLADTTV